MLSSTNESIVDRKMVSVIIPVYNVEDRLAQCIQSVLRQSYENFELILVDDGSIDGSLNICEEYAKKDKRVHVISQKNQGVSVARNKGITHSSGEYIQFIDGDDYIDDNMIMRLVDNIEQQKSDLVICGIREIHPEYVYDITPKFRKTINLVDIKKEYPEIFESNSLLNSPVNKLYKKCKIKKNFPVDLSLGEDLIFNLDYMRDCRSITFTDEIFYFYLISENGLNRKYRENSIEIAEQLYIQSKKFIEDVKLGQLPKIHISQTWLKFMFYGFSDLYMLSSKSNDKKKEAIKKWMNNQNVREAIKIAKMQGVKNKLAMFLVRHRLVTFFHWIMLVKCNKRLQKGRK